MLGVAIIVALGTVVVALFLLRYDFSDMAPSHTSPILLGAIEESRGAERDRKVAEFRAVWRTSSSQGGVRRDDWIALAKRWNVCDGLTNPPGCRLPKGQLEPQGLAVETLDHLAGSTAR